MAKKFAVLNRKIAFNNKWRRVDEWLVCLLDGTKEDFYFTVAPEIVVMFALTEDKKVIVNYQYHIFDGKWHYELPAGYIDKAGSPLATAKRELLEETGYKAKKWKRIGYGNLGKWNANGANYFVAEGARKTAEQNLENAEDIKVCLFSIAEFKQMLHNGKIGDNLSIACAYSAMDYLKILK